MSPGVSLGAQRAPQERQSFAEYSLKILINFGSCLGSLLGSFCRPWAAKGDQGRSQKVKKRVKRRGLRKGLEKRFLSRGGQNIKTDDSHALSFFGEAQGPKIELKMGAKMEDKSRESTQQCRWASIWEFLGSFWPLVLNIVFGTQK